MVELHIADAAERKQAARSALHDCRQQPTSSMVAPTDSSSAERMHQGNSSMAVAVAPDPHPAVACCRDECQSELAAAYAELEAMQATLADSAVYVRWVGETGALGMAWEG